MCTPTAAPNTMESAGDKTTARPAPSPSTTAPPAAVAGQMVAAGSWAGTQRVIRSIALIVPQVHPRARFRLRPLARPRPARLRSNPRPPLLRRHKQPPRPFCHPHPLSPYPKPRTSSRQRPHPSPQPPSHYPPDSDKNPRPYPTYEPPSRQRPNSDQKPRSRKPHLHPHPRRRPHPGRSPSS